MSLFKSLHAFDLLMFLLSVVNLSLVAVGENQATVQCSYEAGVFTCRTSYHGSSGTSGERPVPPLIPIDCSDVYNYISTSDGIYSIKPIGWTGPAFEVYCSMSNGGGWTVFQRHQDASVDFYRDWGSYKHGFGSLEGNFWLGNDKIHALTNQTNYELQIDFLDRDGVSFYLTYDLFHIGNEEEKYRLDTLGGFHGNTGYDYMAYHHGMYFSTNDRDNDHHSGSCPGYDRGGWWYNACFDANLNGDYTQSNSAGVCVLNRATSVYKHKLRYTEMKIRPA